MVSEIALLARKRPSRASFSSAGSMLATNSETANDATSVSANPASNVACGATATTTAASSTQGAGAAVPCWFCPIAVPLFVGSFAVAVSLACRYEEQRATQVAEPTRPAQAVRASNAKGRSLKRRFARKTNDRRKKNKKFEKKI
jgi:hypothetical protein